VRAGLVSRPEQWEWSSYPGYRDARRAQPWVAHDVMLAAWQGDQGGRDPRRAYARFVEGGLADPPPPPFREAVGGWILGSERFVARLRSQVGSIASTRALAEARQLAALDPKRVFAAVAEFYGVEATSLSRRNDPHVARAVAAWLCRRHTEASLRELADFLGLSRADSVPNLTRRLEARLKESPELSGDLTRILERASEPADVIHPTQDEQPVLSRRSEPIKTKLDTAPRSRARLRLSGGERVGEPGRG
jgi:hypothetical protein